MTRRLATIEQIAQRFADVRPHCETDRQAVEEVRKAFDYKSARNIWQALAKAREDNYSENPNSSKQPPAPPNVLQFKRVPNYYDLQAWQDRQSDLMRENYVVVGHKSDVHAPFEDPDALALSYQLDAYLQPHVIAVGSDFCDFPTISAYAPDPELGNDDILDTLRPRWWNHVDAIKRAAPNATLVWIDGNHDDRLRRFLDDTAPQIRHTVQEAFVEFIRYQGRVLYIGRVSEIDVGVLTVLHGDNSVLGEYGARKLLMARRSQRWYMFGHSHTPKEAYMHGDEYEVGAAGGGHLGQRIPHYQKQSRFNGWMQGSCYAVVGMKERRVWFSNQIFYQRDNLLTTALGNRVFAQEMTAHEQAASAAA